MSFNKIGILRPGSNKVYGFANSLMNKRFSRKIAFLDASTFSVTLLSFMVKPSFITLLCILFSLHVQCQTKDYQAEYAKGYWSGYIKDLESIEGALEFAAIGDWGRNGEYFQKDVAQQLAKAVTGLNASFIISTGDNIYPDGVASVQDPLWQASFENIFFQYALSRPWYAVLGNHDYHGNAQAQVRIATIYWRLFLGCYCLLPKKVFVLARDQIT